MLTLYHTMIYPYLNYCNNLQHLGKYDISTDVLTNISTDMSVDISTDISVECRLIYQLIHRSICWPIYRSRGAQNTLDPKDWTTGVQCESRSSLADNAILKYVGLGATADPEGSNFIWRTHQSMRPPLIVISFKGTNLYHAIFLI